MKEQEPLLKLVEDSTFNDELWVDEYQGNMALNIIGCESSFFIIKNEDLEKLISVLSNHLETIK